MANLRVAMLHLCFQLFLSLKLNEANYKDKVYPVLRIYGVAGEGRDVTEGRLMHVDCHVKVNADEVTLSIFNETNDQTSKVPCVMYADVQAQNDVASGTEEAVCRAYVRFSRYDHGMRWWCTSTWREKEYKSIYRTLHVKFPPRLLQMVQRFSPALPNTLQTFTAKCVADSANPTANITWMRDRLLIHPEHHHLFTVVAASEPGLYNALGTTSELSVQGSLENHNRKFECSVVDETGQVLAIDGPTFFKIQGFSACYNKPCHNGGRCRETPEDYVCECAKGYTGGLCETENVSVAIEGYDAALLEGEDLTLTCNIIPKDADVPQPYIVFTPANSSSPSNSTSITTSPSPTSATPMADNSTHAKRLGNLTKSGRGTYSYSKRNVTRKDAGVYTCVAGEHHANVNVSIRPVVNVIQGQERLMRLLADEGRMEEEELEKRREELGMVIGVLAGVAVCLAVICVGLVQRFRRVDRKEHTKRKATEPPKDEEPAVSVKLNEDKDAQVKSMRTKSTRHVYLS